MKLSNKLFLIGLGLLFSVAVGTTVATSSYISNLSYFDNIFTFRNYEVVLQNIVTDSEATAVVNGKYINADTIVENLGDMPVLVRISYVNSDKVAIGEYEQYVDTVVVKRNTDGQIIDSDGKVVELLDLTETITDSIENTESEWKAQVANSSDFERGGDGCYYYKGILNPGESIQHLDSVTLVSTCDSSAKEQTFYKTGDYDTTDWKSGSVPSGSTETGRKSVVTFGSADPLKLHLAVVIETIQATDTNFNAIVLPENVTASTMKGYWDALSTTT